MRRGLVSSIAAVIVAIAVVGTAAGCRDEPSSDRVDAGTTTPRRDEVHEVVATFLERAETAGDVAFTAEYAVLAKLGGVESSVAVAQDPPRARISTADLAVYTGPDEATCFVTEDDCVDVIREDQLTAFGITSRFYAEGAADALRALARRTDAEDPVVSTRTAAGVTLDCVAIPVGGAVSNTSCLTPEGVFGFVDSASLRFELTAYAVGPPEDPLTPPP